MSRFRDEQGIALPASMGILVLLLALGAWTASSADVFSKSTTQDHRGKRAMAAADAGLHAATNDLEAIKPTAAQCLKSGGTVATPCPAAATQINLGNGATASYEVSPIMSSGTCAGKAIPAGANTRCITAVGSVSGVTRRLQSRVSAQAFSSFTPMGVVGKTRVDFNNSIYMWVCPGDTPGAVATNGTVYLNNSIVLTDNGCGQGGTWSLNGPSTATMDLNNGITPSNPPRVVTPALTLPAIDPWPATHDNNLISGGQGRSWNQTRRELTVTGTYTLPAGTYSLCSLELGNGATLTLGGPVKIYIDSPNRAGSGCQATAGYLRAQNSNAINWPAGGISAANTATAARNLHVFVYGVNALDNPSSHPTFCGDSQAWGSVVMCNSSAFAGTVYSPNGRVYLGHGQAFVGSIAADRVYFNNSVHFRFPSGLNGGFGSSDLYGIRDWTECAANGSGTTC